MSFLSIIENVSPRGSAAATLLLESKFPDGSLDNISGLFGDTGKILVEFRKVFSSHDWDLAAVDSVMLELARCGALITDVEHNAAIWIGRREKDREEFAEAWQLMYRALGWAVLVQGGDARRNMQLLPGPR